LLLVADVRGMSRSANALVRGYRDFDPGIRFAGVIFNHIGSPRHRDMIEEELPVPAFGWIPWQKDLAVESRHLGLRMAFETAGMAQFGGLINEHCDIGAILDAARSAPAILPPDGWAEEEQGGRVKIGVASDPAFCFYYQDNLDRLSSHGADLVFFSPMNDHLPKIDGLYLGGGYPELYAQALENGPARLEIRHAIEAGMPAYGECGGLVYLTRSISTDREYRMIGLLPARAFQHERFQALGYVSATCSAKTPLIPLGHTYRGHEFHYSSVECDPDTRFCLTLARGSGIDNGRDGISEANALAGYTHAYFTDTFARSFIRAAATHTGLS
ncbi:MAG: cobyrinate a,c-diamide synthase, partial [Methanomicrobiaceae archaeon]|nr:cobyrinate a,c-diamide synthase [Methanomicrobiaceae archaeon]